MTMFFEFCLKINGIKKATLRIYRRVALFLYTSELFTLKEIDKTTSYKSKKVERNKTP